MKESTWKRIIWKKRGCRYEKIKTRTHSGRTTTWGFFPFKRDSNWDFYLKKKKDNIKQSNSLGKYWSK